MVDPKTGYPTNSGSPYNFVTISFVPQTAPSPRTANPGKPQKVNENRFARIFETVGPIPDP